VNVIQLNRQLHGGPTAFLALALDQRPTVVAHWSDQYRLTTLRSPDQVVHDQMYGVLVA